MNYITVEDVLQLDVAKEWKVAAGEDGLSNTVSWFYVCQENEISPWVEGREIMILYGSGIKTDTPDLVRIVDICAQKQLSAIIVLLGHYIHSLPPEMLGEADVKNVPIIIMPVTQPIVHVTKALAELLMGVHERMRQCGELLKDMIFGFDSDISKRMFAMEQAGFEAGKAYRFVVFEFSGEARSDESSLLNKVRSDLNTPAVFFYKDYISALVSDRIDKDDLFRRTKELLPKLYEICGAKCCAVLGSEFSDVMIIKSSYRDALKAADCFPIFEDEEKCIFYDGIPAILKLLFRYDDPSDIKDFFMPLLGDLIDFDRLHNNDLLNTLWRFLRENCNASRAAEKLYIHRNTMNNRLRQIFDLLGTDCSSAEGRFAIDCAMYCYKYAIMQDE